MAQFTQFGRPLSVAITSPSLTITDLTDLEVSFDPELIEHFGGAVRFPDYTIGADNTTVTFTTTDVNAVGLVKGMEATAVVVKFEGPDSVISNAGVRTKVSGMIGLTISNMRVMEAFRLKNDPTGKPGEFSITMRAAIVESTGADPSLTFDVAMETS